MRNLSEDVRQAEDLRRALERFGFTDDQLQMLCQDGCSALGQARDLLLGDARLVRIKHIADLAAPVVLDGHQYSSIVRHRKMKRCFWESLRLVIMDPNELQYTDSSVRHARLCASNRSKFTASDVVIEKRNHQES